MCAAAVQSPGQLPWQVVSGKSQTDPAGRGPAGVAAALIEPPPRDPQEWWRTWQVARCAFRCAFRWHVLASSSWLATLAAAARLANITTRTACGQVPDPHRQQEGRRRGLVVLLQKRGVPTGYLEAQSLKRTRGFRVRERRQEGAGIMCAVMVSNCRILCRILGKPAASPFSTNPTNKPQTPRWERSPTNKCARSPRLRATSYIGKPRR